MMYDETYRSGRRSEPVWVIGENYYGSSNTAEENNILGTNTQTTVGPMHASDPLRV